MGDRPPAQLLFEALGVVLTKLADIEPAALGKVLLAIGAGLDVVVERMKEWQGRRREENELAWSQVGEIERRVEELEKLLPPKGRR